MASIESYVLVSSELIYWSNQAWTVLHNTPRHPVSLFSFVFHVLMDLLIFYAGGFGIANMIEKIKNNEYMGFENLCRYQV